MPRSRPVRAVPLGVDNPQHRLSGHHARRGAWPTSASARARTAAGRRGSAPPASSTPEKRDKIRRRGDDGESRPMRARSARRRSGMGMQQTLRARRNGVIGILNGVDYREWDPRARSVPDGAFRTRAICAASRANKRQLLQSARPAASIGIQPLIGMVTPAGRTEGHRLAVRRAAGAAAGAGLRIDRAGQRRCALCGVFRRSGAALSRTGSRSVRATTRRSRT